MYHFGNSTVCSLILAFSNEFKPTNTSQLIDPSESFDASFMRIVTSTPKPYLTAIDYSLHSLNQNEPLDLSLSESNSQVICLALPKVSTNPIQLLEKPSPLDLRTTVVNSIAPDFGQIEAALFHKQTTLHTDAENEYSKTQSEDPSYRTESDSSDTDDEDSTNGDPTFLNDLTIFDYFQHFQTLSDNDSDVNQDEESDSDEIGERKRSEKDTASSSLSQKRFKQNSGK